MNFQAHLVDRHHAGPVHALERRGAVDERQERNGERHGAVARELQGGAVDGHAQHVAGPDHQRVAEVP